MKMRLDPGRSALMIIDVQEKLATAMPDEPLELMERNIGILAEAARRFEMPVVMTEQYPKGLGRARPKVAEAVDSAGDLAHRVEKIEFSVCDCDAFAPIWDQLDRREWILAGMECHICVWQSARHLLERGAEVHVVRDAVTSRFQRNWETGLSLMEKAGAVITSTETVVFDLLGEAGTDDFKAISRLVR